MLDRAFWETTSKKDWNDFWYNSEPIHPTETKHNYNELVDYQVQSMKHNSPYDDKELRDNLKRHGYNHQVNYTQPFDTEAYLNYKEQMNYERAPFIPKKVSTTKRQSFDELYEQFKSKSVEDQIENLKGLGRELVERIDRIVDRLDVILEEDKKD